ncbi:MAG: PKD domain-containing protein [Gaiellaceae bacterium]
MVSGAAAAAASAPRAWPGQTIGYRDLTGAHGYHAAVRRAAAAWNQLDLGVRFVPAPRGQSAVQIVFVSGRCLSGVAGRAPAGFQREGARVVVHSCPAIVRPLLVAHELGRVLGLPIDDHACSLMNSKGASDGLTFAAPARCHRVPPPAWLPGLIDPLTAARARTLYAAPPAALDVRFTPGPQPRLDWRQPSGSSRRTLVVRTSGSCPTRSDVAGRAGAAVVYSQPSYAGLHWAVDTTLGSVPGSYCYRLFNVSATGRATPSAVFTYVLAPGPVAVAAVTAPLVAGAPATFADRSTDGGASIVHWHWDFGDPASGAANVVDTADPAAGRRPSHAYATPGTYTVTLTVADNLGRTATTTISVTVQPGAAP